MKQPIKIFVVKNKYGIIQLSVRDRHVAEEFIKKHSGYFIEKIVER